MLWVSFLKFSLSYTFVVWPRFFIFLRHTNTLTHSLTARAERVELKHLIFPRGTPNQTVGPPNQTVVLKFGQDRLIVSGPKVLLYFKYVSAFWNKATERRRVENLCQIFALFGPSCKKMVRDGRNVWVSCWSLGPIYIWWGLLQGLGE